MRPQCRRRQRAVPHPALDFVEVGRVVAPHGAGGELQVAVSTDVPNRFAPGGVVFLQGIAYAIDGCRSRGQTVLLKLRGIDSREEAGRLRGVLVEVPRGEVPPAPEGTYYYFQLMDMAVYTTQGERLGTVAEILRTGANDVYVVRHGDQEVLVPAVAEVVVEVDVAQKRMTVALPEGLR